MKTNLLFSLPWRKLSMFYLLTLVETYMFEGKMGPLNKFNYTTRNKYSEKVKLIILLTPLFYISICQKTSSENAKVNK